MRRGSHVTQIDRSRLLILHVTNETCRFSTRHVTPHTMTFPTPNTPAVWNETQSAVSHSRQRNLELISILMSDPNMAQNRTDLGGGKCDQSESEKWAVLQRELHTHDRQQPPRSRDFPEIYVLCRVKVSDVSSPKGRKRERDRQSGKTSL